MCSAHLSHVLAPHALSHVLIHHLHTLQNRGVQDGFFPSADGWEYNLSDGVTAKLRLSGKPKNFVLQWFHLSRVIDWKEVPHFMFQSCKDTLFEKFKCP